MKCRIVLPLLLLLAFTSCATTQKGTTIVLKENPTTGYQWEYSMEPDGIVAVSDTYAEERSAAHLVGVGGNRSFLLTPLSEGTCIITFRYKRAWEEQEAESRSYRVTVAHGKASHSRLY